MPFIHVQFADPDGAPRRDALRDFGFDEAFLKDYLDIQAPGDLPARVVEVQRGRYGLVVRGRDGLVREADGQVSGRLLHEAQGGYPLPSVGDWVALRLEDGAEGQARPEGSIRAVLPRRSAFVRRAPGDRPGQVPTQVLAANVDTAFIVAAADARWSPRRIERYLTLAYEAGVEPVVVITKADLALELTGRTGEELLEEAQGLSPGLSAVLVCAPEAQGLGSLSAWLRTGKTIVLLGSSGAGKSTLLNALAGHHLAATQEVRSDDSRGRHTTTHRELFRLPSGALVIDSPGLREIQVLAGEDALAETFGDVEALAASCRFRDCAHGLEPGCAVRAALESGELDRGRYEGWRKIGREVAYLAAKEDPRLAAAQAERWRQINKSMRGYTKERRSIQGKSR